VAAGGSWGLLELRHADYLDEFRASSGRHVQSVAEFRKRLFNVLPVVPG
jgi:hypothetical protein